MNEYEQDIFKAEQGSDNFDDKNIFEGNTSISREEIVQLSLLGAVNLKVSEKDVPNPEFFQEISEIRDLIEVIISNEELLTKFVELEDSLKFRTKYLPKLVDDIVLKSEMKDNEDISNTLKSILKNSDFRTIDLYVENHKDENLYKAICKYADAYFQTKDMLKSVHVAKKVIETCLPDFYKEFPFSVIIYQNVDNNRASHEIIEDDEQDRRHLLRLEVLELRDNRRDYENMETTGAFEKGYSFRCKNSDLISMIHEYAHGLYSEIVNEKENEKPKNYYETADSAINEGFAVFIEIKCCEKMINNAKIMNLDERDIKDLQERKDQRTRELEKYKYDENKSNNLGAYAEGIEIMNMLYESGGIKNIKEFLENINIEKSLTILRSSQEYREALCDEEKLKLLFK